MLKNRDIPFKQPQRLSRLTVNSNGVWSFQIPSNIAGGVRRGNVTYYKIPYTFGLCRENASDPSSPLETGKPGDYLLRQPNGTYTILESNEYNLLKNTGKTK